MTNDVIEKFEEVSKQTILNMINESFYNIDLKLQLLSKKEGTVIKIEDYMVIPKKINLFGVQKTFYDIYFENELIYEEVCLMVSVIEILKNLISKRPYTYNNILIILDTKYSAILGDMLLYKNLIKNVKSPIKKSILHAKYEARYSSSIKIKEQIAKNYK